MKIFILDTEANSLTPDRFWCAVLKEFKKDKWYVFINDTYLSYYPWRDLVGFLPPDTAIEPLSKLKGFIQDEHSQDGGIRVVGHNNIDYDFHWLKERLGLDFYGLGVDVRDSYVLSRLARPRRLGGHSVKAWGVYFGLVKTEIEDEQWANFDPIMITRCIGDVRIQEQIYDHLREKELRGFSAQCIELEHDVQRIISQQRRDGVFINEQKVHELYLDAMRHADFLQEEIRAVFPPKLKFLKEYKPRRTKNGEWAKRSYGSDYDASCVGGDFSSVHLVPFNVDSPPQRLERLLEIGWKPTEFTKPSILHPKGQPKFTEDSLASLPENAPKEARLIGEYLMSRSRQRVANQIIDGMDRNGYLHGWIDILGANTHRMSSNGPNLQNIASLALDKEDKPIKGLAGLWGWESRDVFTVENLSEDCLVDADASGIQLRGLAHYGGDNEYIHIVSNPNIDPHRVHADILGCTRSVAKTFIYAFLMGAGAKKLIFILGGDDVDKGRELLKRFYNRFPFLKRFKEELDIEVERGYHIGLDGRLIAHNQDMPHTAMAIALQSYEAIIMKKGLVLYQSDLKSRDVPFVQRIMVHDEYLSQTKWKLKDVVGQAMVSGIVKAGEILESKCPLAGQYKTGSSWAEVH